MATTTTRSGPDDGPRPQTLAQQGATVENSSAPDGPQGRWSQVPFSWGETPPAKAVTARLGRKLGPFKVDEATEAISSWLEPPAPLARHIGSVPQQTGVPSLSLENSENSVGPHDIVFWVSRYLKDEVAGVLSPHTLEAKVRDLKSFIQWLLREVGHAVMDKWLPRDTQGYIDYLIGQERSAATINRHLASIRKFAHWSQEQSGGLLQRNGLPTRGVRSRAMGEPDCNKLTQEEIQRLFDAAERLCAKQKRKNARPRRDRAILSLLYHTGLRVSEVASLQISQWQENHLNNVRRKGRAHTNKVYLVALCRGHLREYLDHERFRGESISETNVNDLFLRSSGRSLDRHSIGDILRKIAREANTKNVEQITIHPHRLRHTFGALFRENSGSDTETASALGHTGLSHVKRYVRKTQQEREKAMDEMFQHKIDRP